MAKILSPNESYTGTSASVGFVNGVGETDNLDLIAWFESNGYKVETEDKSINNSGGEKIMTLAISSEDGKEVGTTRIIIENQLEEGNSYIYKVAANPSVPDYDKVCKQGWTAWDGVADIVCATGQKIVIAECDADGKAKKAGLATVTAKA